MLYIFVYVCSDWSELQNASILQAESHTHNLSLCLAVLAFTMHLDSCSVGTLLNTLKGLNYYLLKLWFSVLHAQQMEMGLETQKNIYFDMPLKLKRI